ncbi:aromatic acid exporter family protein [Geodermatophilus sp. YIM 151500]|uniref:FUSC family protein n=1 Tax=Geodermatophilus sp. YIM 151500 TaxID=2984531 RepID=UPI0021E407BB|nr:FUSC family protein [Geodermatophilus sp. YIM 151500]MCV2490294.1 aromatic acid exporter family protein [Geodermatophilus sp. YIM 151500]
MTGATVAAFLVAELVGLRDPPPIIAALTALLVVQATLTSTLVNGVQRVASVVAGVALAVLVVALAGLTWWSLAALVAASIVVGQLLRLGPHLVEVPISAMLVLGVGSAGAESVGAGRIVETLIGAAVGMLVNVLFPPAVQTRYAAQSVKKFADEIAGLLREAAAALGAGPVTAEQSTRWLEDARRLNRHAPRVDRALAHAEESRRLNVRALRVPPVGVGMRTGLDNLEHTSVSLRTLFRVIDDATREQTGVREDAEYADAVRRTAASLLERMGNVVGEFGQVLTADPQDGDGDGHERLSRSLEALHSGRDLMAELLISDPRSRSGLWELNSTLLTTVDRLLDEVEAVSLARGPEASPDPFRSRRAARVAARRLRIPRRSPAGRSGQPPVEPLSGRDGD